MQIDVKISYQSDEEVLCGVKALSKLEREQQAEFLGYLVILEERKLYAGEGYSSLFSYLVEHLHYSESSALKRIQVSRLCQKYPEIYALVAEGKVSLSSLQRVAPHLKAENRKELLEAICHKKVREVEAYLASLFPKPGVPDKVEWLDEEKVAFQFTANKAFLEKLNLAKAILGKKIPSHKTLAVLEAGLDELIASEGKRTGIKYPTPEMEEQFREMDLAREQLNDPHLKILPVTFPAAYETTSGTETKASANLKARMAMCVAKRTS